MLLCVHRNIDFSLNYAYEAFNIDIVFYAKVYSLVGILLNSHVIRAENWQDEGIKQYAYVGNKIGLVQAETIVLVLGKRIASNRTLIAMIGIQFIYSHDFPLILKWFLDDLWILLNLWKNANVNWTLIIDAFVLFDTEP